MVDSPKKLAFNLVAIATTVILSGCDSGGTNGDDLTSISTDRVITTRPLDHSRAVFMASTVSEQQGSELLTNGDFNNGLDGWITCSGEDTASVAHVDGSNQLTVASGDCIQQGVRVVAGDKLALNCSAALLNAGDVGWAGVGLSFYDENWQFISEPSPAVITKPFLASQTVVDIAPEGAVNAAVWIFAEDGAVLDGCELSTSESLPPPAEGESLLYNAFFDEVSNSAPVGWVDYCDGVAQPIVRADNGVRGVNIGQGACLTQSLDSRVIARLRGQDFKFTCFAYEAQPGESAYAEISTNLTGSYTSEPVLSHASSYSVSGTVSDELDNAYVSIYIEGDNPRFIPQCYLVIDTNPNQRPVALDDSYTFEPDSLLEWQPIKITHNDFDPDGTLDYSSVVISQYPTNGFIWINGFTILYRPNVNAPDQFKYYVADGMKKVSNEATVTIGFSGATPSTPGCNIGGTFVETIVPQKECDGLLAIYAERGDVWRLDTFDENTTPWASATDPCNWGGIECSDGKLVNLSLFGSGLVRLPNEIGDFQNLTRLTLGAGSELTGPIPASIGQLSQLEYLAVINSGLTGTLPVELGQLSKLEELIFANNSALVGTIPNEIGNLINLTTLSLLNNSISGAIPATIGNLSNLEDLNLSDNDLSGPVPVSEAIVLRARNLDLSGNGCLTADEATSAALDQRNPGWRDGCV